MKPSTDLVVRGAIAFVATLALAPVAGALLPSQPFHGVMTRTFLIAFVVSIVVRRGPRSTWAGKFRAMGFRGPYRFRRVVLGTAVGLAAMALLLLVSWALGGRDLPAAPHRHPFALHVVRAFLLAAVVALFEEILARGYLKDAAGNVASAVLFSVVHLLQPAGTTPPAQGYDPLLAVKRLGDLLGLLGDPARVVLGFLCLFAFGLALNRLRDRTGTLYLGMGIHFGAVFVIRFYGRFLTVNSTPRWAFGGPFLSDGLLPLLALLLLLLASYRAPLPAWARA
ncbi:MAG: CPBP family intramembrane glutamic endopeptidase [Planctomycetota bacterium]